MRRMGMAVLALGLWACGVRAQQAPAKTPTAPPAKAPAAAPAQVDRGASAGTGSGVQDTKRESQLCDRDGNGQGREGPGDRSGSCHHDAGPEGCALGRKAADERGRTASSDDGAAARRDSAKANASPSRLPRRKTRQKGTRSWPKMRKRTASSRLLMVCNTKF